MLSFRCSSNHLALTAVDIDWHGHLHQADVSSLVTSFTIQTRILTAQFTLPHY